MSGVTRLVLALAVLAAFGTGLVLWRASAPDTAPPALAPEPAGATDPRTTPAPDDPPAAVLADPTRAPGPVDASADPALDPPEPRVEPAPDPDLVRPPAVRGVVTGEGGAPLPGATVRVELDRGASIAALGQIERETAPLGRARTAADGRYAVHLAELDGLADAERALHRLAVVVTAPGWQPARRSVVPRDRAAEEPLVWRLDVALARGGAVAGRVVDARGAGVLGAELQLVVASDPPASEPAPRAADPTSRAEEPAPRASEVVVARATSGADGRYALPFVSGGTYALAARHPAHGTARVADLELGPAEARELADVVLGGPGRLAGHVRHASGAPMADLLVEAVADELAGEASSVRRERRAAELAAELAAASGASGLWLAATRTDAAGRFELTGLREGRFALALPELEARGGPDLAALAERRFPTGAEDIELALDAPRLAVRVTAADGRPLPGVRVVLVAAPAETSGGDAPTDAPTPARPGTLDAPVPLDAQDARGPDARAVFAVETGASYVVAARLDGRAPAEARVTISATDPEPEVVLALGPAGALGRLGLVVTDATGARLEGVQASLETPLARLRAHAVGTLLADAEGWLPPVPAGRYLLSVRTSPPAGELPLHFPLDATLEVRVEAGVDRWIEVEAPLGGRLALELAVVSGPDGFDPDATAPEDTSPAAWEEARLARFGARASLDDGRGERPLTFVQRGGAGARVDRRLLPGASAVCEPLLEPGPWRLRVTAPGFEPVEREVRIEPGLVQPVRISLRAQ